MVLFACIMILVMVWVKVVRDFAVFRALFDVPNERSSHSVPVPRLGGAAFMPVVFLAVVRLIPDSSVGGLSWLVVVGAVAIYIVSVIDDVRPLSTGVRFVVQFAVAALFLVAALDPLAGSSRVSAAAVPAWLQPASLCYWLLVLWFVGLINVYNFMDGIDGIAGLQAVIGGVAWAVVGYLQSLPTVQGIGMVIAAANLGFLTFNWHPAKIFMGDAGSTVLGFFFAVLPFLAAAESKGRLALFKMLAMGALVVWPFLADGVFTFVRRVARGENILKAHRSHLYQRLVIAGYRHDAVTLVFGGLAVLGAVLAWWLVLGGGGSSIMALSVPAVFFFWLWYWVRWAEARGAKSRS